jgi:acyl-CoA thioesterase-2
MRVADRDLGDNQSTHQALLAFASELTLIGTALLPHGEWSQLDAHGAVRTSVIGHHVLFHRPFRLDDWLLISQTSPVASGGSAYGTGHVYDIEGVLVASFAQQSMIRVSEDTS